MQVFMFLWMIDGYYDPKQVREIFSKAYGMACKVLGVKLNEGFREDFDEMTEFEFGKSEDILDEAVIGQARRENIRKFEDDVLTYLILKSSEYVYSPEKFFGKIGKTEIDIYYCVNSSKNEGEKARVLQCNADFRFFGMASGFISICDKEKACSAACYRGASALFESREGRSSQRAQVLDKLGSNFQRYFVITKEVFEESLTRVNISQVVDEFSSEFSVDKLLELLHSENDPERRLSLINRLKGLTNEGTSLNNLI